MAISKEQFKAANARGAAAIGRGPIARAARYDSRRELILFALEGGCEFSFPVARCLMLISMFPASSSAPSVQVDGCNRSANSGA
jgi:hypothetical protein